jgi:hypothetical protein
MTELPPALAALASYRQFVTYKVVPSATRPGKTDKLPTDYRTGKVVSAHDPQYWCSFAEAAATGQPVGFVFTRNDPFWFLDIDNCLVGGAWSLTATDLCTLFAGCAVEVSQSGTGLHIFGTGTPPAHGCRNAALGLEFYHQGRFVALTGINAIGSVTHDASSILPAFCAAYFPAEESASGDAEWTTEPVAEWRGPIDDADLIRRAINSKSANNMFGGVASFADLWLADEAILAKCYPDPERTYNASSADAALAQHLAFWTGKDCERIDRLMRQSQLVRPKWDRRSDPYLERTILGAVARQVDVLQDQRFASLPASLTVPSRTPDELVPEDFWAYLPTHTYINVRTRELLPAEAVNGHLRRFKETLGMKPSEYLDLFRAVQQMSWQPSHPEVIEGMVADGGQLRPDAKGRIYNRYRASDAVANVADATPWLDHVRRLYPNDADHMIRWFAYRVQYPGGKINHALVIGGAQGIGKDMLLEPLRYGVGASNFADLNPGDLLKDFTDWVESTLLIINEARDLGDVDRYKFYEHSKRFIAAPPDTLPCNRKYHSAYNVPNAMGVVITSNNKLSGLYIDPDDRRHYVAWSDAEKQPSDPNLT